jgi:hypothetical protein
MAFVLTQRYKKETGILPSTAPSVFRRNLTYFKVLAHFCELPIRVDIPHTWPLGELDQQTIP